MARVNDLELVIYVMDSYLEWTTYRRDEVEAERDLLLSQQRQKEAGWSRLVFGSPPEEVGK